MEVRKGRHLLILKNIIGADRIITSEDLALNAHSSIRTIKSDIAELNEQLKAEGIGQIISTRSKGYVLKAIDASELEKLKHSVMIEAGFFQSDDMEKVTRRILIAQKILLKQSVKVDDLAEELYLTKSAIKDDMAWVKQFFESYDVKLVSHPRTGLTFNGGENNLRFLMMELFCSQYHDLSDSLKEKGFDELFYNDKQYYSDLRHDFLRILRESSMSLHDISTKKMATYLCLAQNRVKSGHVTSVNPAADKILDKQYELSIARQVFASPLFQVRMPEQEIRQFAVLLMCYRDIDLASEQDQKTIDQANLKAASDCFDEVLEAMDGDLGGKLLHLDLFDAFRRAVLSQFMPIYLRSLYDSNRRIKLITYYEFSDSRCSPLAMEIVREIQFHSEQILHSSLDRSNFASLTTMVDLYLGQISHDYKKRRLALASTGGRAVARNILNNYLNPNFGKMIEYVHIFDFYEMRRIRFEDYDLTLTDMALLYNYYPINYVNYNPVTLDKSLLEIFSEVFLAGYSEKMVNHMIQLTELYPEFDCADYMTFFKLISYRYGGRRQQEMQDRLIHEGSAYSYYSKDSGVSMIFCDYRYTHHEFIGFYRPSKKMHWTHPYEIKTIVAVCLKPDTRPCDLKMANAILRYLYYDNELIDQLFHNAEDVYMHCFRKAAVSSFERGI